MRKAEPLRITWMTTGKEPQTFAELDEGDTFVFGHRWPDEGDLSEIFIKTEYPVRAVNIWNDLSPKTVGFSFKPQPDRPVTPVRIHSMQAELMSGSGNDGEGVE